MREILRQQVSRHRRILACLAIAALVAVAYANALPNSFHFDDLEGVKNNPMIRVAGRIPAYFTDVRMSSLAGGKDYRPVVLASYALDYARAGLDPMGFRLTNMAVHIAAACLLFLVAGAIFESRPIRLAGALSFPGAWVAWLAAALFAVHTANSEAVDYIWARSATLATLFYLASFYCFLRGPLGEGPKRPLWHAAGLACFVLGLLTKATIVTLPAALVLYEALFRNGGREPLTLFFREPARLKKYIPIAAIFAGYVIFRFIFLRGLFTRMVAANRPEEFPVTAYLLTQFRAWIYYIRLFLWPHPLITDYPGFGLSSSLWDVRVLWSLAAILAILIFAWRARRSEPAIAFFTGWYFLVHLPESSFIPLSDLLTGYRAYPANVALAVLAAVLSLKAAAWIWARMKRDQAVGRARLWQVYGAAWAVVLAALIATTVVRNRDWRDEITLWSDVVEKDPANPRALANLAREFMDKGDYQGTQALLERAIAVKPEKSFAFLFRSYLHTYLGNQEQALLDATRAIQINPRAPAAYYYRGEIYRKAGEYDRALADYQSTLARTPFHTNAYLGIALARMDKGEPDKAAEACAKMTGIDPTDARGYNCLGILLLEQNRIPDAVRMYQRGVIHAPQDSGLWYGLGLAYEQNRMYKEAADAFERSGRLAR